MIYDDGLLTCVRREALPSTSILSYNLCCFLLKFHYNAVLNPLHPESLSQTVSFCCFPQTIFMPLSNDGFGSSVAFLLRSAGCSFTLHQNSLSDGAADDLSSHIQNALAVISAESPLWFLIFRRCFPSGLCMQCVSLLNPASVFGLSPPARASRSKEDWLSANCKVPF